jgi:hypothetical protein
LDRELEGATPVVGLNVAGVSDVGGVKGTVPFELTPGSEYVPDDDGVMLEVMLLDAEDAKVVGVVIENWVLLFPAAGLADDVSKGVEVPAAVNEALGLDMVGLKTGVVPLLRELKIREVVVIPLVVIVVSDTAEALPLGTGDDEVNVMLP